MDRVAEILAILNGAERAELTDIAIGELENELLSLFDSVRAGSVEGVDRLDMEALTGISDTVTAVRELAAERITAAETAATELAEREAAAAALEAQLRPVIVEPEVEQPLVVEPEPILGEVPAEAEVIVEEPVLVGAQASTTPPAPAPAPPVSLAAAAANIPATHRPVPQPRVRVIRDLTQGRDVSLAELCATIVQRHDDLGAMAAAGEEKVRLGRLSVDYPDERRLSSRDPVGNEEKLALLLDDAYQPDRWLGEMGNALVASGGFCALPTPLYDLAQISGAQRPVWDYLPKVQADRGAITFMRPTSIADVLSVEGTTAGRAVSVWTNTTDTTPGGATKPVQTVNCGTSVTVTLEAIVEQLQFGNFGARAFPEWVAKWLADVAAIFARMSETRLLNGIDTNSTAVTATGTLGAAREFVSQLGQAAARYRNNQRMGRNARLRVLMPSWAIDIMQADIALQHPGDGLDSLMVTEGQIRAWLSNIGLNATFYDDSATGAAQLMGAQGPTDIRNFPAKARVYMFHEGAFVGLDGGTLDLGVVRDSTLNGTNDYRLFMEAFQNVAFRGIESVKIDFTVCNFGTGALDITTANRCAAS